MTHIWSQTVAINEHLAKALIEKQHSIKVSSIKILGEGFDNIAYLINQEFVFRFPKREAGIECIENEIVVVPYIANLVSFKLSYPQYIGKPSDLYVSPFAGYRMLHGTPLCETPAKLIDDKNFAKTLACWLKELHSIPVLDKHVEMIKGDQSWRLNVQQRIEVTKNRIIKYEPFLSEAGFDRNSLFKTLDTFKKLDLSHAKQDAYVHGDLYSRHILTDENIQPTGLIDWGDIHIGSPGSDLSVGFMIFSDQALTTFLNNYGNISEETKSVALLRTFYHSIILLSYCYEKQEENLKKWTIIALKNVIAKINANDNSSERPL